MQFGLFGDHTFWASDLAVLFPMSRARQNRNSLKASSVFPRLANAWPFLKWPCNATQPSLQPLFLMLWEHALRTRWSDRYSKELGRESSLTLPLSLWHHQCPSFTAQWWEPLHLRALAVELIQIHSGRYTMFLSPAAIGQICFLHVKVLTSDYFLLSR